MADSSATDVEFAGRASPDPEGEAPRPAAARRAGPLARFFDSDLWYSFRRSPVTMVAAVVFRTLPDAAALFGGLYWGGFNVALLATFISRSWHGVRAAAPAAASAVATTGPGRLSGSGPPAPSPRS